MLFTQFVIVTLIIFVVIVLIFIVFICLLFFIYAKIILFFNPSKKPEEFFKIFRVFNIVMFLYSI